VVFLSSLPRPRILPPDTATAETLFDDGENAYYVGDFDKAIARFEAAYGASKLPAILYNIGLSYYRRFSISGDVRDLKRARAVLQNFKLEVEQDPRLGNEENVAKLLAEIDAALAGLPSEVIVSRPNPENVASVPPAPRPEDHKLTVADDEAASLTGKEPVPQWRGRVAAGSALVGVGAGTLIAAVAMAIRGGALEDSFETMKCSLNTPTMECDSLMDRGRRANTVTAITAVAAPLLMAGGATLLTLGLKRRAAHRRVASPYVAPGSVGIVFQGRF
jgi:tetratricopeptide (TPR) repeat protein